LCIKKTMDEQVDDLEKELEELIWHLKKRWKALSKQSQNIYI
jgi:hypothetical protein